MEPVHPQIGAVLSADDMDVERSDGSRRGYENNGHKSDQTDRHKPKARRLSSGGMVRAQRKRRARSRANTLPDLHSMAANGPAVEHNGIAHKRGEEAENSSTQLLSQTARVANRASESGGLNSGEALAQQRSSSMADCSSELTVTTVTPASSSHMDEFCSSEIGGNHYGNDAISFCSSDDANQQAAVSGSGGTDSDALPRDPGALGAASDAVSPPLQPEASARSTEVNMFTVDINDCDIALRNKNEVHKSHLNGEEIMPVLSRSGRRWSLPDRLETSETYPLGIKSTNDEFEQYRRSLRRAQFQTDAGETTLRKRSGSLPNHFTGMTTFDLLPPRLPATGVTNDFQCNDNPFEPDKAELETLPTAKYHEKIGRSQSWPSSALIYLEVSFEESRSGMNDDVSRRKSLPSLEHVFSTSSVEDGLTEMGTNANCLPNNAEIKTTARDKEVKEVDEAWSWHRARSKSLADMFTFSKEKHVIGELTGSSFRQASDRNKYSLHRSESLPSVLRGRAGVLPKFREIPHSRQKIDVPKTMSCEFEPPADAVSNEVTVERGHATPTEVSNANGAIEDQATTLESRAGLSEGDNPVIGTVVSHPSIEGEEADVRAGRELPANHEELSRDANEESMDSQPGEITEYSISGDAHESNKGKRQSSNYGSEIGDQMETAESREADTSSENEYCTETHESQTISDDTSENRESPKGHEDEGSKFRGKGAEIVSSQGNETQDCLISLIPDPNPTNETNDACERKPTSVPDCEIPREQICIETTETPVNLANKDIELESENSISQQRHVSETDDISRGLESSSSWTSEATGPRAETPQTSHSRTTTDENSRDGENGNHSGSGESRADHDGGETGPGAETSEPQPRRLNAEPNKTKGSEVFQLDEATVRTEEPSYEQEEALYTRTPPGDWTPSHAPGKCDAESTQRLSSHENKETEDRTGPDSNESKATDAFEHHTVETEPQLRPENKVREDRTGPDSNESKVTDVFEHHTVETERQWRSENEVTEDRTGPDSNESKVADAFEHHTVETELQPRPEKEVTEDRTGPDSNESKVTDVFEHHTVETELQPRSENDVTDSMVTPDLTASHVSDATYPDTATTEPQSMCENETTADHTGSSNSSYGNDEHHPATTEPQPNHIHETTETNANTPQPRPEDANAMGDNQSGTSQPSLATQKAEDIVEIPELSRSGDANDHESPGTSKSQTNLAMETTEDIVEIPDLSRSGDANEHESPGTSESQTGPATEVTEDIVEIPEGCGVGGRARYGRLTRRPRSFTLPHTMESIVEVPNEHAEDEHAPSWRAGSTVSAFGRLVAQASDKAGRAHQFGLAGRSHSLDFGDLRRGFSDTLDDQRESDPFATEREAGRATLGTEDVELTLPDVPCADSDPGAEQVHGGKPEEKYEQRIAKFDSILSNVVSSFFEPDYALSSSRLHRAVAMGDVVSLKRLVENGTNVNAVDEHGLPALHVAVVSGDCDMVECLLESGADLRLYTETLIREYIELKQHVYYNLWNVHSSLWKPGRQLGRGGGEGGGINVRRQECPGGHGVPVLKLGCVYPGNAWIIGRQSVPERWTS